ncbi:hypothetical protein RFI_29462 [Reticulomyxa filosa]|uniref:Uncharacterized protein n=1 Tax=Reticulomyxa filosa TaxID=46433 RepID=X6M239_RETFI|nr:hypothetical protein RFI_29462 [Reticulomyxa filosa]|eukprot:ETO07929.1 hypothetical protein RFI_29462 [Reticulomyxa filosa]
MHALNAFVVRSNSNNMKTRNCRETNGQVHFNQHSNINIWIISCDQLLNRSANYVWKCEQCLQFYNDMACSSAVQIVNNESLILNIEIIRILRCSLVTNLNHSKKILHTKTLSMNIFISTPHISSTIYKLTHKAVTLRFFKNKINSVLTNGKVEEMLLSNRACNSQEQVCLRSIVPSTTSNTICSQGRFTFSMSLAVKSNGIPISNFAGFFESIAQCCNLNYAVPLLNGKWIDDKDFNTLSNQLQLLVQCDRKSVVVILWPKKSAFNDRGAISANEETGRQRIRRASRSWCPSSFMQISTQSLNSWFLKALSRQRKILHAMSKLTRIANNSIFHTLLLVTSKHLHSTVQIICWQQ